MARAVARSHAADAAVPDKPAEDRRCNRSGRQICFGFPGLVAVIVAGVLLVSASDIVVIYVPLLGAERHIDVHDIGLLLTVRAGASMVARLFYPRIVARPAAGR